MKTGGVSWNTSQNHKHGVAVRSVCKYCGKQYKMTWAKNNHEKLCGEESK